MQEKLNTKTAQEFRNDFSHCSTQLIIFSQCSQHNVPLLV